MELPLAARAHARTRYNEGVPADLVDTFAADGTFLPTSVTTSGWTPGTSISPPPTPSSSTGFDPRTTRTGYGNVINVPGSVAGWSQRAATSTSTDMPGSGAITYSSAINATGVTLATKQPLSNGADAGTTLAHAYTAGPAGAGVPAECANRPGWDGLACVTAPADGPLPTTTVTDYSTLLAPVTTTQTTTGSARSTNQTYDLAGRPVTTTVTGDAAAGIPVAATTVGYSSTLGSPVSVTRDGASVTTGYDSWGRVVETTDATGNTGTVAYNVASAPAVSNDGFASTSYTYDTPRDGDRLGEHRGLVTMQLDALGEDVPGTWTAAYGPTGSPSSVTAPNGVVDSRTYSTVGSLVSKAYTDHTGTPLMTGWSPGYNVHGQVVTETGPVGIGGTYATTFTYDTAGRLTTEKYVPVDTDPVTRTYELNNNSDRVGSTTTIGAASQKRTGAFNAASQLRSTTATGSLPGATGITNRADDAGSGPGGTSRGMAPTPQPRSTAGTGDYVYDGYGRTTTLPGVDTTTGVPITYGWKINDRVNTETMTTDTGQSTTTVTDDPTDRRATAATTGAHSDTFSYIYGDASDNPAVLTSTRDGGETSSARYTTGPAGGMSIIQETTTGDGAELPPSWWTLPTSSSAATTTTVNLQLSNPHGDIVASTPNTTTITASQVSTATAWSGFGLAQTGGVPSGVYGWEGSNQRDTLNPGSLITMGARLYNQTTGTFLTLDPIPGGNANPYTYPTDPCNRKDLDGKADRYDRDGNRIIGSCAGMRVRPPPRVVNVYWESLRDRSRWKSGSKLGGYAMTGATFLGSLAAAGLSRKPSAYWVTKRKWKDAWVDVEEQRCVGNNFVARRIAVGAFRTKYRYGSVNQNGVARDGKLKSKWFLTDGPWYFVG